MACAERRKLFQLAIEFKNLEDSHEIASQSLYSGAPKYHRIINVDEDRSAFLWHSNSNGFGSWDSSI